MSKPQDEDRPAGQPMSQEAIGNCSPCCGGSQPAGRFFEIRVKDHLNTEWSDWLEGLALTPLDNGEMVLSGTIVDQAALMGILNKLNRLNLTILSVSEVSQEK